jgi:probable H4MPT-linked C1 transfer pathway protein
MPPAILALDIGGANLKAAHSKGLALLEPFELWRNPAGLADALRAVIRRVPRPDLLAVTMTGELCDCFPTKHTGVDAILDAVRAAADSIPVRVWQTDGGLVDVAFARSTPRRTAAANWLALAEYAGRFLGGAAGLVVDVGSTTTDIIPCYRGRPQPAGRTDPERLRSQELVYTGTRRTPLCALLGGDGAAELFATTLDVYLILGHLREDEADRNTADGRPATRAAAAARLARMQCADLEIWTEAEVRRFAEELHGRQLALLRHALNEVTGRLPEAPRAVVVAGSGEFLARAAVRSAPMLAGLPLVSLGEQLGPEISQAACAYALMVLAKERYDAIR